MTHQIEEEKVFIVCPQRFTFFRDTSKQNGAVTYSRMTSGMMTLCLLTLSTPALSVATFSVKTPS
jgi:hypothetical protein